MSYATVANLREYLSQVATGATVDSQLQRILDRANAIVNDALGIEFAAYPLVASERDILCLYGGMHLWPPAYQATTLTKIEEVYSRGTAAETTVEVDDWLLDEHLRPYRVWLGVGWSVGRWYRLTATWGYGPAPASVVEVEIEVAVNIWRSRDAASFSDALGSGDAGGITVNRAMTWAQRSILDGVRSSYLGIVHA
jgi:hypothetical protein